MTGDIDGETSFPVTANGYADPPPAHLAKLADRARDYVRKSSSDNTRRAYASDWKDFASWCRRKGLEAIPPRPQTIGLYITALAAGEGGKPASVHARFIPREELQDFAAWQPHAIDGGGSAAPPPLRPASAVAAEAAAAAAAEQAHRRLRGSDCDGHLLGRFYAAQGVLYGPVPPDRSSFAGPSL